MSVDEGTRRDPNVLLASVALAAVDGPVEHSRRRRQDGRTVEVLRFWLGGDELAHWLEESYGPGGGPGRAWVTYENVKDILGISEVPNTWRLSRSKVAGSPLERYVLIDDGDPAAVTIGISPTLDVWPGNRW